jgi:hypothetical protein
MKRTVLAAVAAFILTVTALPVLAKPTCLNITAESVISNNDIPSARIEAINRAKWLAVEQIAGVDVKSRTIVENGALLDDIITTRMQGVVSGYRLLDESRTDDILKVGINACIEPFNAKTAISALALNTSISLYIPSRKPAVSGRKSGEYEEENILSQSITGRLVEQGFKVHDIAESHALKLKDIDAAFKGGKQSELRNLIYRYLSNSILIGRIEPTVSFNKGEDAGYGIRMPFNNVTVRLTYRLMSRGADGRMVVLAAGTDEANGLAPAVDDAYAAALKNLSDKFLPLIMEKIYARMKEIGANVTVKVEGVIDPSESLVLREALQRITWVSNVENIALDEFRVSYPENPVYLANSLTQNGFRIVKYSKDSIRVRK